ncbi:MAG TPA: hypothetical protein VLR27_08875 [Acidimicrobiales bacterium]|nr:hypothetical protein [Acidimicrobiales bacterium]
MRDRTTLRILLLAVVGTAFTVALLAHDLSEADHISNVLLAGEEGPSVDAVTADIPDADLAPERGHDGQQFYAIARAPMHLDEASEHLDRPRYRLQRPLFSVLAWALHPSGGGTGLVVALLVVGVAGVLLSGVAAGALSHTLGGGTWPALLVPVLPGAFGALRITAADTLALGLLLAAVWAAEIRRSRLGVAAAVAAVLAKESMALLLVAHAATRRTRESVLAALAGVASAGTWWVALRLLVDSDVAQVKEFTWPFGGMIVYVDEWLSGHNLIGAAMAIGSFLLAFVALWRRGPRHPLFGTLAAMTALASVFAASVVALDYNAIRTLGPLLVIAILTLGTPTPTPAPGHDGAADPGARRVLVDPGPVRRVG